MDQQKPPILVWEFKDAPETYKNLSTSGGDEDWVAFVPKGYKDKYISWLESGTGFGVCDVQQIKVKDGHIYIGCHS